MRELDDAEIIVLTRHLDKYSRDADFWDRHKPVLEPVIATMDSDRQTHDAATVQEMAIAHLKRLGLLKAHFSRTRKNEVPEFDENTGMLKASGVELTPLGLIVLRRIGLANQDNY